MRELLRSIRNTIRYADKYGGKITEDQVFFRLLSGKKYDTEKVFGEIKKNKIKIRKKVLDKESDRKLKIVGILAKNHLVYFPTIIFLGVTGSVAARNARQGEDIDLLLVCKTGTMWLTRLELWLYLKLRHIPHRKYGQEERKDEFCFNLWLEEDSLRLPPLKQNQKNAVDLILMVPILDRSGVYPEIIKKNSWAKKYVANGYQQLSIINYQLSIKEMKKNIFLAMINTMAYWGQIGFIRLKGPINSVDKHRAFFHETKRV